MKSAATELLLALIKARITVAGLERRKINRSHRHRSLKVLMSCWRFHSALSGSLFTSARIWFGVMLGGDRAGCPSGCQHPLMSTLGVIMTATGRLWKTYLLNLFFTKVGETCIFHKRKSTIRTRFVIWRAHFQQIGWQFICLSVKKGCKYLLFDSYRCFAATTGIPPDQPNEQVSMCWMWVTKPV